MRKVIDYVREKKLDREAGRYFVVGVLTTLINFGLFTLMHEVMGIDTNVSNVVSLAVSVIFAYVTNKLIVFRRRCDTIAELAMEFLKFIGSRLVTIALEIFAVWLLVENFELNAIISKGAVLVVVVILNYIISKLIVFRKSNPAP